MTEKIFITLALLIFLGTGVVLFLHESGTINPVAVDAIQSEEPANPSASGNPETGSQEAAAAGETRRLESHINTEALELVTSDMSNASLPTDADYWGAENDLLPKFAETLNAIFAGNEDLLPSTFLKQKNCGRNDYRTLEDVERGIADARERFTERSSRRSDADPERTEHFLSAMELNALEQISECGWRHQTAARKLRNDVARQAQAGNVMARYVYAIMLWPSPHEENYPEEHAAWVHNALKFSEQNILQGWTLGFEAMEMSATWGLFTPVSQAMAQAWGIVITTCPITGPAAMGGELSVRVRGMFDFSNSAPIHAARLIEQHCPDSLSTYTPPDVVAAGQSRQ